LARKYKELAEKEMRKWEKKAEQDKMRYQEEMKHYIPAEDPTGGKKGKKQKKVRKESVIYHLLLSGICLTCSLVSFFRTRMPPSVT
jgi:hypothetical protein